MRKKPCKICRQPTDKKNQTHSGICSRIYDRHIVYTNGTIKLYNHIGIEMAEAHGINVDHLK